MELFLYWYEADKLFHLNLFFNFNTFVMHIFLCCSLIQWNYANIDTLFKNIPELCLSTFIESTDSLHYFWFFVYIVGFAFG